MAFPTGAVPIVVVAFIVASLFFGKRGSSSRGASRMQEINAENAAQVTRLTLRMAGEDTAALSDVRELIARKAAKGGMAALVEAEMLQALDAAIAAQGDQNESLRVRIDDAQRQTKPQPAQPKKHERKHKSHAAAAAATTFEPRYAGSVPLPSREPLAALAPLPRMHALKALAALQPRDPTLPR